MVAPIQVTLYAYPYFENVPTCPTDSAGSETILTFSAGQVITRNIYRLCKGPGGNVIQATMPVGQINDNTTTVFRDRTS